jgi:hypothetical protein
MARTGQASGKHMGSNMTTRAAIIGQAAGWGLVTRLVEADGSAACAYRARLLEPQAPLRDLGDLIHTLCAIHGHHPGMADAALAGGAQPAGTVWLEDVADAFAAERGYLARLVAAAGPLPSTPGQAETEAALMGQRHALEMLGRSDRAGCASGAVAALVLDWRAVRPVLDHAAYRFGLAAEPDRLPPVVETATAAELLAATPAASRAMAFGAQQYLAQARGLWTLLETRAGARG